MDKEKEIFDRVKVDKRKTRDINLDGPGLKSAFRATQKLPQAVLKVSSYSHGKGRAAAHLEYISRKGDLEVEDPQGNRLSDPEELKERIEDWSMDFDKRKRSRDTVNIVLSAPSGSELGAVENSVREFAQAQFGETNDYLFAIHNDTDNPHGHLMVKMRGYDGEKLDPGKEELRLWREQFAQSLRDNGIEVDATPRYARGVGSKSSKQKLIHLRKRQTPDVDKNAIKEVIKDISEKKDQSKKPWSIAAKKKTAEYKAELKELSEKIKSSNKDNETLDKIATAISVHAEKIPEPKTKAEEIQRQYIQHQQDSEQER